MWESVLKRLTICSQIEILTLFPLKDIAKYSPFRLSTTTEFIDEYHRSLHMASLFEEVVPVLTHFNVKGIQQVVLSAMEHDSLMKSLSSNGILPYFEKVSGLNDHYAHGKVELGLQLLDSLDMPKDQLVMVGDTLHDKEVADCLGIGAGVGFNQSTGRGGNVSIRRYFKFSVVGVGSFYGMDTLFHKILVIHFFTFVIVIFPVTGLGALGIGSFQLNFSVRII